MTVLIETQHFLDAVDTWHSSCAQLTKEKDFFKEEDYTRFDAHCGLLFIQDNPINLEWDNNWFVFEITDVKLFQKACLKHGWNTKSMDDDGSDQ